MADIFNNNPTTFVNMNELFLILNDKIGLTSQQWRKLVENTNYLYNNLGLADVDVGTVTTQFVSPGTFSDVIVTHREETVDGKTTDYFDYVFKIPTPNITTEMTITRVENDTLTGMELTQTPITQTINGLEVTTGYNFSFNAKIPILTKIIYAYIVSESTPLSSGWLTDIIGGEATTPQYGYLYVIMSSGEYYLKQYIWNGTSSYELTNNNMAPNIYETTNPTTATVGTVGQLYFNSENNTIWKCTGYVDPDYIWELEISAVDTDTIVSIIKAYPTDLSNTVQLGVSNVNEYAEYTGGQMTPTLAETLYGVDPDTKVFCTKSNAIFKNGSVYGIIELSEVGRPTTYSFIETESPTIPTDTTKEYTLVPTGENDTFRLSESSNFVSSYIVGETPLASDWLSLEDSGSALTPVTNKIYIIKTAGDYYNKQYTWNGTVFELISSDNIQDNWNEKTWTGLTDFDGDRIWTDGTNIYLSEGTLQYVLNKDTSTWSEKTWTGLTSFNGSSIWTDGTNIYYSNTTNQYVLDKETNIWSEKIWSGLTNFNGFNIWTDGTNIYYSAITTQYILNKETSTWSAKTWTGLTSFFGQEIWTDGINYYYSYGAFQYVLNKETSTWSEKTWTGLTDFDGDRIWTDGTNIYYSNTTNQYVLDKETNIWSEKIWSGLTNFNGFNIWTDEVNYYYSDDTAQYVLILPFVTLNGTETLTNKTLTDPTISRIKNGDYFLSTPTLTQNETIATLNDIQSAATNHANLSNLDYASSGHTGFIGGNTQYGGTISDNLDTINKSGFYTFYSTAVGSPFTSSGFMQHENSNAGTVSATQKAVAYDSTDIKMVVRVKTNSTWGDWVKITTEKDTQTYTTTLPTTSGGDSDWQAITGGYELAKTITGLTIYDSIVTVADDDTIWTDNELNATITTDTLTFFVSSLPSAEVTLTLTITKSTNGGTI